MNTMLCILSREIVEEYFGERDEYFLATDE